MNPELIREQLDLGLINSSTLLSGTKLLDEKSRDAPDYKDRYYIPFYYHLGKQLTPKSVIQVGAKLGLIGAAFLKSCKSVESWMAMDHDRYEAATIITSNLRLNTKYNDSEYVPGGPISYMGLMADITLLGMSTQLPAESLVDLCFLTENFGEDHYINHLNFLWNILAPEGLLVADYITAHNVFHEFCRVKNREPIIFETRYGVGIIQR